MSVQITPLRNYRDPFVHLVIASVVECAVLEKLFV